MAGMLEKLTLKLDLQGFEQIQGLGRTFKKLENNAALSQRQIKGLRTAILGVGKGVGNTIGGLNAQVDALTRVREGARIGSRQFRLLSEEILRVKASIEAANASMVKSKFGGGTIGKGLGVIGGAAAFGGPVPGITGLAGGLLSSMGGGDFLGGASTGVGVGFAAKPLIDGIAETAQYTATIEKSKIALEAATRVEGDAIASKKAYAVALGTAASITERFNVPQELAARGMTRLSAAVIGAGGNIHNAGIAFENISAAIKATGGSTEDTKAAVTAMVQIFSKGKVSAEELSGQLGERFPAAVTLFAEANNMTTQELQKGLKDGVIGLDKLWKFVLKLGDKYVDVADSIGAASVEAGARSRVAWNEVKLAVGKALQPIGADLQVIGAEILTALVPALQLAATVIGAVARAFTFSAKVIVENFDKLIVVLGTFTSTVIFANRVALVQLAQTIKIKVGAALSGLITKLGFANVAALGFTGSIKAARVAVVAFTASLVANPLVAAATGLSIAATAAFHFGRKWQRMVKEIEDGKMSIGEANIEIVRLEEAIAAESNERVKARLQTQLEMYKEAVKERQRIEKKARLDQASDFEGSSGDDDRFKRVKEHIDELGMSGEHLQDVYINAFTNMEDALNKFVTTGKLNFKEFARSVIADIQKMIIKQMLFNALSGFMKAISPATPAGGPPLPKLDRVTGNPGPRTAPILKREALGGVYSNGIRKFAKGGVVNRPTLFPFAKGTGLMGEAGPEAILPLQRGRGGRLGVAMQGGGGGTTNVNYTGPTLNFNGDEYVPKSAVGGIISAAAARGESKTISSLKNSRGRRASLGL